MGKVKKCAACNIYTLKDTCPECGSGTKDPAPPKFSFPDRYGEQRREALRKERD